MIMLIVQLAMLVLLSICLGYLLGQITRNLYIAKQLKSHDHEYHKLRDEAGKMQYSLDNCSSHLQIQASNTNDRAEIESEIIGADDLKRIYGIGIKLEHTLNDLGIFRIDQISELTKEKEQWIDSHLRFKGRIERDMWIEQAKIIMAGE